MFLLVFGFSLIMSSPLASLMKVDLRHGLPSNVVTTTFEDQAGFLWIGTNSGLARFDGSRLVHALDHREIQAIHQDPQGRLWVYDLPFICERLWAT